MSDRRNVEIRRIRRRKLAAFREARRGSVEPSCYGAVKVFWPKRGYGFIRPFDGGKDVFVHLNAIQPSGLLSRFTKGLPVRYDVANVDGKVWACNLKIGEVKLRKEQTPYETGTVKWFDESREYGFIIPERGGKEVFVHISVLRRSLVGALIAGERIGYRAQVVGDREKAVELVVI